ncbi:hypothetical protein HDU77_008548 [Chytriomyces hyalinus]|nr:hypothetical protein HDU77_008548 [Chytriomyces hyalinus]
MPPSRIIVDCDLGIDDTTSLVMLLRDESVCVEAITVVDGNIPASAGVLAALRVLLLMDKLESVPVYLGAETPLLPGIVSKECWPGHGPDGLGGFSNRTDEWAAFCALHLPEERLLNLSAEKEHAVTALLRMVNAAPGEITILALGPLTNIALALSLDPSFLSKVKALVVMGGATSARGNSNRTAEFNFHCDPESVHVVLHAASKLPLESTPKVTLVPWETTVDHAVPWTFFDRIVGRNASKPAPSKYAQFFQSYVKFYEDADRKHATATQEAPLLPIERYYRNHEQFIMCDMYATVCAVDPSAVTEFRDFNAQIELGGTHSRGLLTFNWHDYSIPPALPNCRVIFGVDNGKVLDALERAFE